MIYPGTWLVLGTLAFIILLYCLGVYWARTQGQFDDFEAAKYAMMENDRDDQDDGP
jgi:nitrogen fixation-related uncharacterized protein